MTRFLIYRSADAQELPCGCAARDKRHALKIARRMFRLDRTAYAMRGASLVSGQDRYTAAGYMVRASKRKPRTLLDKDKARYAALSSIRAGAQRAEVFALVPIGHARRGAEWRPS